MKRLVCAASLLLLIGCIPYDNQDHLLTDPNFNSWCGESLCHWKTEQGRVRRAATWETSDYGVELESSPSIISQEAALSALGDWYDPEQSSVETQPCMKLTILGDVEAEAEVRLELDFFSDGTADYEDAVPSVNWKRIELLVRLPAEPYSSMKVSLHKQGVGRAVFAKLDAVGASNCRGEPIELLPRKSGGECRANDDCEGARCDTSGPIPGAGHTCAECLTASDCTDGLICAVANEPAARLPFRGCVSPGGTPAGLACNTPEQCETGLCFESRCSECSLDEHCGDGELCGEIRGADRMPYRVCVAPGSLATGDYCRTGAECASGRCNFTCLEPD